MDLASRAPVGRLNGIEGEPGTLLGPDTSGRFFVILGSNDERGVTVGFANADDLKAADPSNPRSWTEMKPVR